MRSGYMPVYTHAQRHAPSPRQEQHVVHAWCRGPWRRMRSNTTHHQADNQLRKAQTRSLARSLASCNKNKSSLVSSLV